MYDVYPLSTQKNSLLFSKIYQSFVTPQILLVYFKLWRALSRDFSSFESRRGQHEGAKK